MKMHTMPAGKYLRDIKYYTMPMPYSGVTLWLSDDGFSEASQCIHITHSSNDSKCYVERVDRSISNSLAGILYDIEFVVHESYRAKTVGSGDELFYGPITKCEHHIGTTIHKYVVQWGLSVEPRIEDFNILLKEEL